MAKGQNLGTETAAAAAATAGSKLTEDMIIEILVKLPVKSLLRFRCVCKSWLDLIKSPNFIDMHLKYHHSNSKNDDDECIAVVSRDTVVAKSFVCFYSHETLSIITSLPKLEIPHLNYQFLKICGPCNGLICLYDDTDIVLCNPLTSEFKLLPLSPCLPCPDGSTFTREAIGLGFDTIKSDYKVVTFVHFDLGEGTEDIIYQVEIYNLSTNSWVEYKLEEYPQKIESGCCGTLFDGSLYWVAMYNYQYCILSYEMSIDKFIYIPLPDRMLDDDEIYEVNKYRCVRFINDCLVVLIYTEPYEDMVVEVLVMREFGKKSSITKQFDIEPLTDISSPSFGKNEALLVQSGEGGLASYALDSHVVNHFDIHSIIHGAIFYQGSLVSIK